MNLADGCDNSAQAQARDDPAGYRAPAWIGRSRTLVP